MMNISRNLFILTADMTVNNLANLKAGDNRLPEQRREETSERQSRQWFSRSDKRLFR